MVSVRVINIILIRILSKLVIYTENFKFSETFLFILLFLKLLEFEMSPKSFHHDNFIVIVFDLRIRLRFKSALFKFL